MGKAAETRRFIVEKTAPIFNVKGYAGTSLTDMTGATGLTKGSIYGNFANKDEVALAAFEHNLERVRAAIAGEMAKQDTCLGKLLAYPAIYGSFLEHPFPKGGCPILNTAIEADDTHARLKEKAAAAVMAWKKTLVSLISEGVAKGEFRPGTDAEGAALTVIAMIEGAIMISKLTGKSAYRKAVMHSVEKAIRGLA